MLFIIMLTEIVVNNCTVVRVEQYQNSCYTLTRTKSNVRLACVNLKIIENKKKYLST